MQQDFLGRIKLLLVAEEGLVETLKNTRAARRLADGRKRLLAQLRGLVSSENLSLIVATEKEIIQGDLLRYANSTAMVSSLKTALQAIQVIGHHLILVGDQEKYRIVDQSHSLAKNRKAGLPFDEARQALASHLTRLMNLDKSRVDEMDKQLIDVRKAIITNAIDRYTQRQAHILGIEQITRNHQGNPGYPERAAWVKNR